MENYEGKNNINNSKENGLDIDSNQATTTSKRSKTMIDSLISGSLSSASMTIIYQPLELLKTRIQLERSNCQANPNANATPPRIIGRTSRSATRLVHDHNLLYLWRGTGASLLRSVPGVGLYYSTLNVLQTNLSIEDHKPDNPTQAFLFGLTARSMVSFLMLPITVVKVRYESGQYKYPSLSQALKYSYLRNGWIGVAPTILRDSLFSGIYYMCYTELKFHSSDGHDDMSRLLSLDDQERKEIYKQKKHSFNFACGLVSGLIASLITNPLDVLKTNIQVNSSSDKRSMKQVTIDMLKEKRGYMRFFDGLVPRSLRRTLIAASTWTFYELLLDSMK